MDTTPPLSLLPESSLLPLNISNLHLNTLSSWSQMRLLETAGPDYVVKCLVVKASASSGNRRTIRNTIFKKTTADAMQQHSAVIETQHTTRLPRRTWRVTPSNPNDVLVGGGKGVSSVDDTTNAGSGNDAQQQVPAFRTGVGSDLDAAANTKSEDAQEMYFRRLVGGADLAVELRDRMLLSPDQDEEEDHHHGAVPNEEASASKKALDVCSVMRACGIAYVHHASPLALARSFFDSRGQGFLLRGGATRKKAAAGGGGGGGGSVGRGGEKRSSSEAATAARTGRRPERSVGVDARVTADVVDLSNPTVLSTTDREMLILLYRKPREDDRRVIELLYRYVLVEGPDEDLVMLYFETVSEAEIMDFVASTVLEEKRKTVMTDHTIVSGGESGCLVLVRARIPSPPLCLLLRLAALLLLTRCTPSPQPPSPLLPQKQDHLGCTKIQLVIKAQYNLDLPDKVRENLLKHFFAPLKSAQKLHENCDAVDERARKYLVVEVMRSVPAPTSDELAMINKAMSFNVDDSTLQRIQGSLQMHPTVHMFIGAVDFAKTDKKSRWGKAYGEIDGALDDVFAWIWHTCSYERMLTHREKNGDGLIRKTDASDKSRSQVVAAEIKVGPAIANRRGETKWTWARTKPGEVAVAFEPTVQGGAGRFSNGAVEAKLNGLYLFQELAPHITTFTQVETLDFGSFIPSFLVDTLVRYGFSLTLRLQEKFRRADRVIDKVRGDLQQYRLTTLQQEN